jgi:hypothetical protein
VTYNDAPIGILKGAEDATRFACDIARMQAQVGRVTWVIVLAEVEKVHRFETRARSNKPPMNQEGGVLVGLRAGLKTTGGQRERDREISSDPRAGRDRFLLKPERN